MSDDTSLRAEVAPSDIEAVRDIVTASGVFRPDEIEVAVELVEERLSRGEASGYHFVLAERDGRAVGYACFGPTSCTVRSFDLYWIAVHPLGARRGLGTRLLAEAERAMAARRIYVETSSRPDYAPARAFYESRGYRLEARLEAFYAPGDDKLIYVKVVDEGEA